MLYRYVIALNKVKIAQEQPTKHHNHGENKLTIYEVAKLMDLARKFPEEKINTERLFTCGFSMN